MKKVRVDRVMTVKRERKKREGRKDSSGEERVRMGKEGRMATGIRGRKKGSEWAKKRSSGVATKYATRRRARS